MADRCKIKISTQASIIGFILVLMAGWINTIGIKLFIIESPAFMTGRGIVLGYWIFKGNIRAFISIFIVVSAFIAGSCISTIITKKTGLIGGLFFVAILLIIGACHIYLNKIKIITIITPMAMGAQNAASSLTPIDRTTHLTGAATDIGINIANRNWNVVRFWILRWIAFPLGAAMGFVFVDMANNNLIGKSLSLFLPAVIIILTAIFQKVFFDIPLLNLETKKYKIE